MSARDVVWSKSFQFIAMTYKKQINICDNGFNPVKEIYTDNPIIACKWDGDHVLTYQVKNIPDTLNIIRGDDGKWRLKEKHELYLVHGDTSITNDADNKGKETDAVKNTKAEKQEDDSKNDESETQEVNDDKKQVEGKKDEDEQKKQTLIKENKIDDTNNTTNIKQENDYNVNQEENSELEIQKNSVDLPKATQQQPNSTTENMTLSSATKQRKKQEEQQHEDLQQKFEELQEQIYNRPRSREKEESPQPPIPISPVQRPQTSPNKIPGVGLFLKEEIEENRPASQQAKSTSLEPNQILATTLPKNELDDTMNGLPSDNNNTVGKADVTKRNNNNLSRSNDANTNIKPKSKKKMEIEHARKQDIEIEQELKHNNDNVELMKQQAKQNIKNRIEELKIQLKDLNNDDDNSQPNIDNNNNNNNNNGDDNDEAERDTLVNKLEKSIFALKTIGYSSIGSQILSTKPNAAHCAIVPGKIPTEPELIIKAKRDIPAAARYNVKQRFPQPLPGGNFANSSERKEIKPDNWNNPGPARYGDTASTLLPKGGRFNMSTVPTFLDLAEKNGSRLPAPSDYIPSHRPARHGTGNGAKWGTYKPKSELEWIELRAKEIPGPKYNINNHNVHKNKGQKFSTSNTRNFIDNEIYSRSAVPGPKYIPGSFDKYRSNNNEDKDESKPLKWDVGGYMNDRISNSIDFLIQQAQAGQDVYDIIIDEDEKDGELPRKQRKKLKRKKKLISRKKQQKRDKEMSKSKQREILLKMKEEELKAKQKEEKRLHQRRFLTYTSPYAHPNDKAPRATSPPPQTSPIKIRARAVTNTNNNNSSSSINNASKTKSNSTAAKMGKRRHKIKKHYKTIKETMKMTKKILHEEDMKKRTEILMR